MRKIYSSSWAALTIVASVLVAALPGEGLASEVQESDPKMQFPKGSTERVIAHTIEFDLDINGESFGFQSTVAENVPAIMIMGKQDSDDAYRVEVLTEGEKKSPDGARFLPVSIAIYSEDSEGSTLLKRFGVGLKIGETGTVQMGSNIDKITLNATAGEGHLQWRTAD